MNKKITKLAFFAVILALICTFSAVIIQQNARNTAKTSFEAVETLVLKQGSSGSTESSDRQRVKP